MSYGIMIGLLLVMAVLFYLVFFRVLRHNLKRDSRAAQFKVGGRGRIRPLGAEDQEERKKVSLRRGPSLKRRGG